MSKSVERKESEEARFIKDLAVVFDEVGFERWPDTVERRGDHSGKKRRSDGRGVEGSECSVLKQGSLVRFVQKTTEMGLHLVGQAAQMTRLPVQQRQRGYEGAKYNV